MSRIYLDHNAGSLMRDEVRLKMLELMQGENVPKGGKGSVLGLANASSVHNEGRIGRSIVADARNKVADFIGTSADHVIFTSSASEAANLALTPNYLHGKHQIRFAKAFISSIEHPCVLAGGRFSPDEIEVLVVDEEGVLDCSALKAALSPFKEQFLALDGTDKLNEDAAFQRPMVAVMLANNETGVIQPIAEIAKITHEAGGFLLVDAVQAAGKLILDINSLGADGVLLSAHKIGGPQGAGAFVLKDTAFKAETLIKGGGQENHHRAGTENILAIAGFGVACECAMEEMAKLPARLKELRDGFEAQLLEALNTSAENAEFKIFSKAAPRLCNTSCFALKGFGAETALIHFDLSGFALSSGSACSSGKVKSSHVLKAMGVDEDFARCALRLSLGWNTTKEDVDGFIKNFKTQINRLYKAA